MKLQNPKTRVPARWQTGCPPRAPVLRSGGPLLDRRAVLRELGRAPRKMPSMASFETRSESAVSASLDFSSASALETWRGILPRTGTSHSSRCPYARPCTTPRCVPGYACSSANRAEDLKGHLRVKRARMRSRRCASYKELRQLPQILPGKRSQAANPVPLERRIVFAALAKNPQ